MQCRRRGNTGFEISALGFGAMRLPVAEEKKVDRPAAIRAIQRAFELGVNYVDSAFGYHYGESEEVIGEALKGEWRGKVRIATKNPYKGPSGEEWNGNLDTQLRRLGVDHIHYYLMHGLAWQEYSEGVTAPGGPLEMAHRAREQGKIGRLCLSCHDTPENMIRLIDTGEFATITLQYNLLDRANEPVIEHAVRKGVGVVVMGPVGGGRLVPPSERVRAMIPGGARSTPEVALRFVLSNPGVSAAISGMGSVEQVEENAATCSREEPLSAEEKAHVLRALEETRKLADLYCTGCNYCMPCPNEVNIPRAFSLMNLHRVYGLTASARRGYAWKRTAEKCVECGECEPKCPQKIPIIERLKEVAEALG